MVGGQYEPVINHALETAKLLVLVFTNADEVNSEWVKHEWKYFSKHSKPILTVFKDCGNAKLENLPYVIRRLQYCDLTEGLERQYEFMLKRIAEIMSPDASSAPSPKEEKHQPDRQPAVNQSAPESKRKNKPIFSQPTQQTQPVSKPTPPPVSHLQLQVGNRVQFGQYPQGANGEVEPLVWRVLTVKDGRALLITEKLIDYVKYNEILSDVTWETCTLRKWMNNDFINKAFSNSQEEQIATVTNQNPGFGRKRKKGGNATQDRIFAISFDEAVKYFRDDNDRMAAVTGHTIKQGGSESDDFSLRNGDKTGWWWLRSPGLLYSYSANVVADDGHICMNDPEVNSSFICVRPAFWLNLE